MEKRQFEYRIAFGPWINDYNNIPRITGRNWPDTTINDQTIKDYNNICDVLSRYGYNFFDNFGFLAGHQWPLDITSVLKNNRKKLVAQMIDAAHERGIKVIYGLGVYSWGFDEIIKNDPEIQGTNPSAMCGSKLKSQKWQEKIIDFIISNFNVDGFHLEASDQGRCRCPQCSKENNIQYYSRLNSITAKYIRKNWPDKVLIVNDCGYLPLGDYVYKEEFNFIDELSENIDVFIDNGNHGLIIREEDQKEFISRLKCVFGTAGSFWVFPAQRWNKLKWFLPYVNKNGNYIKKLFNNGGRACNLYLGPTINPGVELNIIFQGLLLSNVKRKIDDILKEVISELYKPKDDTACNDLIEIFSKAESAYFKNWTPEYRPFDKANLEEYVGGNIDFSPEWPGWSTESPERSIPGELILEPLASKSRFPGPPAYLLDVNMTSKGRLNYKKELRNILINLSKFKNEFDDSGRIERIKICIENVIKDLEYIEYIESIEIKEN